MMSWGSTNVPHGKGHDASTRVSILVEAFLFIKEARGVAQGDYFNCVLTDGYLVRYFLSPLRRSFELSRRVGQSKKINCLKKSK